MTGIGAFVVAVITVSVLSSSCVTSYPVGLRTSRSDDKQLKVDDIRDFHREFLDKNCSKVNTA